MLSSDQAARFANLALACVHREYPNKIAHILNQDADALPPRALTPAFYGCFDWHSAVHGHWLLVRLLRMIPDSKFEHHARHALARNLTAENLAQEARYLQGEGRASFERPYGLAWLLQLAAELHEWKEDVHVQELAHNIEPLEREVVRRFTAWLPKLPLPVRSGEHSQTAFALGLALDYTATTGNQQFASLLNQRAKAFYMNDRNAPLAYEPSGEDFLSPTLAQADVMRRVLDPQSFPSWLSGFLPELDLRPAVSPDRADGKLAHLDGLNLSRAWMLEGIASALPEGDLRKGKLQALATIHAHAGLEAVTGEHYEGGHWLASFAVYLLTRRGIKTDVEAYSE